MTGPDETGPWPDDQSPLARVASALERIAAAAEQRATVYAEDARSVGAFRERMGDVVEDLAAELERRQQLVAPASASNDPDEQRRAGVRAALEREPDNPMHQAAAKGLGLIP